jgi:hypothetical protein
MTTNPVDLLAAIGAHLAEFELPEIASVHVAPYLPGPPVTVQLPCRTPAAIAAGLLAWADTLSEITTEAWCVPRGNSVHLSVTGRLPGGAEVQVYGALGLTDGVGADLAPDTAATVPLAALHYLATPGQPTEEVTL